MKQRWRLRRFVTLAIVSAVLSLCAAIAQGPPRGGAAPEKALADVLAALVRGFNAHDPAAISSLWKENAEYTSKSSGTQLKGRTAIREAYAELFKSDPKAELRVAATNVRLVSPAVAQLNCVADVRHSNGDVTRSEFSALLTEESGRWLLDHVQEADVPSSPAASSRLNDLGWLVGRWADPSPQHLAVNEFNWGGGRAFLIRNFQLERPGEASRTGTQFIGWDAEDQCLRSWMFNSDGTFGEGTWHPEGGDKWVNKMVLKLPDGRRASLSQVFTRTGNDQISIAQVDREIDGAPQPNSPPVTLLRTGTDSPGANPPAQEAQR